MPEYIFTIDITETWLKKVKVIASDTGEAMAKAKAEFIRHCQENPEYRVSLDSEAEVRDVDFKLQFPTGNPVKIG